jgi:protein involved in polysaccharide export with SLBB domain
MKNFLLCFVLVMSSFLGKLQAQIPDNLTQFKASMISDAQLRKYIKDAGKAGLTESDIIAEVRRRGLPEAEITVISGRVRAIMAGNNQTSTGKSVVTDAVGGDAAEIRGKDLPPVIENPGLSTGLPPVAELFGASLFANANVSFAPNLRIPTPVTYKLGPDDELIIDVSGINESIQKLKVSPEGAIRLNYIGPVYVNGLTIAEARNRITSKLATVYPAVKSGNTRVQISLGAIRSIKVTILGSVLKPGTYTLPSLATLFNALYASGGPDSYGSFRSIEVIRNNKVLATADIYRFLLHGNQEDNIMLEDMDVIRIPMAKTRVNIQGEIKRSGLFEILPGETLETLIQQFAGGYQRSAYTAIIKAERISTREKQLLNIPGDSVLQFIPRDGDAYTIGKILDRYENAVTVSGAVYRAGAYALSPGMTIQGLITLADGYKEDVYKEKAILYRVKADLTREMQFVSLTDTTDLAIVLRKDDELMVKSIFDFHDEYRVSIGGAVRKPASFPYADSISVKQMIFVAAGLVEDAYLGRATINRRKPDGTFQIIDFNLDSLISHPDADLYLEKQDEITIYNSSSFRNTYNVGIRGEIRAPGNYEFKEGLTLKEVVLLAGGFTKMADIGQIEISRRLDKVDPNNPYAPLSEIIQVSMDTISLDKNGVDFLLQPYDLIAVKSNPFNKEQEVVSISGAVLFQSHYALQNRQERLSSLVKRAGGILAEANIKGAKLRRQNLEAVLTAEKIAKMSQQAKDSTGMLTQEALKPVSEVVIDLEEALRNPGGNADLILKNGDDLFIPKKDAMVEVSGEVLHPVKVSYKKRRLKYYIGAAGGFVSSARRGKVFVVYANGKAARTKKRFIVFNRFPKVEPGAQVFIPKFEIESKPKKSATELMALSSAVATLAYLIIFIAQQSK